MTSPAPEWRWSFAAIPVVLILTGVLHLGVLFLAVLFSFFLLRELQRLPGGKPWAAIALFIILAVGLTYGATYFLRQAVRELPEIIDKSVPAIADWAKQRQIVLPFTDYDSLKDLVVSTAKSEIGYLGEVARVARGAASELTLTGLGIIAAMTMFYQFATQPRASATPANLDELGRRDLGMRFSLFYHCFADIMGAQLVIAIINSLLCLIFVVVTHLPHAVVAVGATFICGLLPVVGNLVSNAVLVCIAFTVSPREALAALVFLVVVHKLEYFLNSKIIGERIRIPIWLTLLALALGEKLMGVTGMILAPVILHYIRVEAARQPAD